MLRAFLRDARGEKLMMADLYDRALFKPLSLTNRSDSIDPYTSKERKGHLGGIPRKAAALLGLRLLPVLDGHQASETTALRWKDFDLTYFR
jgi:hypothetical protein